MSVAALSMMSKNSAMAKLFKSDSLKSKATEIGKLSLIVLPPLIAVGYLSATNVMGADESKQSALNLQHNLDVAKAIGYLVTMLQKERGMTCVFLNSRG